MLKQNPIYKKKSDFAKCFGCNSKVFKFIFGFLGGILNLEEKKFE